MEAILEHPETLNAGGASVPASHGELAPGGASVLASPPAYTECVSNPGVERAPDSREMARRLQELIEQIQNQPNPAGRALLQDCLQSFLAFYGDGLSRILTHIQGFGTDGRKVMDRLLQDQAVSGLLLIHGLHPVRLEERLRGALEKTRPYMQSHGGNIELLSLENEVARVKLQGTCKTCPSSTITLELAVRRAVEEACPDLLAFEVVSDKAGESESGAKVGHSADQPR